MTEVVVQNTPVTVVTENPVTGIIEVITPGPQGIQGVQGIQGPQGNVGPQGPPGPNDIGGYPVSISNPAQSDVLSFTSLTWSNTAQAEITDGGNF